MPVAVAKSSSVAATTSSRRARMPSERRAEGTRRTARSSDNAGDRRNKLGTTATLTAEQTQAKVYCQGSIGGAVFSVAFGDTECDGQGLAVHAFLSFSPPY